MGFEPTTASLEGWNSTTELRPPMLYHSSPDRLICSRGRQPPRYDSTLDTHIGISDLRSRTLASDSNKLVWWAGKDSNLGSHKAADLQSAPFVHLGTCPSLT